MEGCKIINEIPTRLLTFGCTLDEDLSRIKYIIVVFPGNPGIIKYYYEFMEELYKQVGQAYPDLNIPVWGIGHAGHNIEGLENFTFPDLKENSDFYDMEGQIQHKLKFLQNHIPKSCKIIGIGHSIGCKLWLELFKRESQFECEIVKCFMLFPTIERMAVTPNGKRLVSAIAHENIFQFVLWPLHYIPTFIKRALISLYFYNKTNRSKYVDEATLQLCDKFVFEKSYHMSKSEMKEVVELDIATLNKSLPKIYFYFGTTDEWCPLDYVHEMVEKLPEMKYKICDKGYVHAFVISSSIEMASIVASETIEHLKM